MKSALICPGQGSQFIGMGKQLAENFAAAKDVFAQIDEALDQKLSALMWAGSEDELRLTHNAQPALMAVSVAAVRALESEGVKLEDHFSYAAGHSLGEYSALTAVGTFSVGDAARLLRLRGTAMQEAVPVGQGAMAALLGLAIEQAEQVAKAAQQGEICVLANDNAPGQVVVSGHKQAVERAMELAKAQGAKRVLTLPVSAPFHSPLMAPAAQKMQVALAEVKMKTPCVPVVANISVAPVSAPESIRDLLVQQVTGRVRWIESMLYLRSEGVSQFVEAGAGNILSGLMRRIDREATTVQLGEADHIAALLTTLKN